METIRHYLARTLKDHGYGGIMNPDLECACRNNNLIPCDRFCPLDCQPGYLGPPTHHDRCEGAEWSMYACKQDRDNAIKETMKNWEVE